jgi:hypothetical protein
MLDINKLVGQDDPAARGHLIELESWDEARAIEQARH